MNLVRENIAFTRNSSKEAIKSNLFGFRVGQIVAQVGQRELTSIFVIEYLAESELPEIEVTIMGLGYVYTEHYLKTFKYGSALPDKWFEFSGGISTSLIDRKNIRPITDEERNLIKKAIIKDPQKFEDKKDQFRNRAPGKKILFEDFKRGLSKTEIKDKLVGFRPGQLITYDKPWGNKPFKEVYMFLERSEDSLEGGTPIMTTYIGALSQRDGKLSQFLARNKKVLGKTPLWAEEKRSLTEEELEKVKKTFRELPNFYKKIIDETGLTPSLNEELEFKRSSSNREIKEKLLGWRPGQILIIKDKSFSRLMAFAGMAEKSLFPDPGWVIRCMEIGHISGNPPLVYIHFGFTEDIMIKRKNDLRIPTEEEAEAIQKAMIKPDYQKYIKKAEEKIEARIFV
jgi:hypothetical protein